MQGLGKCCIQRGHNIHKQKYNVYHNYRFAHMYYSLQLLQRLHKYLFSKPDIWFPDLKHKSIPRATPN